ncbi:MAG: NGG1p interacting factor NIF3 [Candidatus Omnitrophica bacterium]|nr:NGG1p interacting factor NIF3 [Candidatus Omnitrophota bacterium]
MNLSQFYRRAISYGISLDPRKDKNAIKGYPDSAILHGTLDTRVQKIMVGIDIEAGELLLAEQIRRRQGLDLVIAHHPEGRAVALLAEVMQLQVDILTSIGIKNSVAQRMLDERKREVQRRLLPANHTRAIDVARILDLPFMCIHTPADNHVFRYIETLLKKENPVIVQDILKILLAIPEYQGAQRNGAGPTVILGNPRRRVGKVLVDMTGGTGGSREVFDKLYATGIRTLVCMHLGEEHFKKAKDAHLNVVIAGHISSDTLGLNLLIDKIEQDSDESFQVVDCSGFTRIKRY